MQEPTRDKSRTKAGAGALLRPRSTNAWWLGVLGVVALGCAPVIHQESSQLVRTDEQPQMDCRWQPRSDAARRGDVIEVRAWDQELCTRRGFEERTVRVDYTEYPHPMVLAFELMVAAAGTYVIAHDSSCEESPCLSDGVQELTGAAIAVPAAIAITVDLFDFGAETREHRQYTPLPIRVTPRASRPRSGVPVRLELDDGDTVRASTDARGKARLPVVAAPDGEGEFIYGVLHVGAAKKRVRFRR